MSKIKLRIAAERIEGGCDYEVNPEWDKLPLILTSPEFIESIDNNQALTSLDKVVGDKFITRGHENINYGADGPSLPLLDNSFQIINNFVGLLPEVQAQQYDTPKKRRVFGDSGYKVLIVEGIRPITKDAPGVEGHSNELADVLNQYGWMIKDWRDTYRTSVDRLGIQITALRAGVTDQKIHTDRTVYGIRTRDKEKAYHLSGVLNSLLYTILQISWYGRIRFTAKDVVSNVRLKSLKKAPIPRVDDDLAEIQENIESTIRGDLPLDERTEELAQLQHEREIKVCELYDLLDDEDKPSEALLSEAKEWQALCERILDFPEEDSTLRNSTLSEF